METNTFGNGQPTLVHPFKMDTVAVPNLATSIFSSQLAKMSTPT
jgi:hypothetical protein